MKVERIPPFHGDFFGSTNLQEGFEELITQSQYDHIIRSGIKTNDVKTQNLGIKEGSVFQGKKRVRAIRDMIRRPMAVEN